MKRRALAILFAIAMTGCARDRADMLTGPAAARARQLPPVGGMVPLEPIESSINDRKVVDDPNTVRAGLDVTDSRTNSAPPDKSSKPKKAAPNMAAMDAPGNDFPNVPAFDRSKQEKAQPKSETTAAPVPANLPPLPQVVLAQPPASTMVASAPGTDLGIAEITAPIADEPVASRPQDGAISGTQPTVDATKSGSTPGDRLAFPSGGSLSPGLPVAEAVAKVGDTIITYREVLFVAANRIRAQGINPMEIGDEQRSGILRTVLDEMIDNTMIIQDFRKGMKKPEMWKTFSEVFDKEWREKELPPLYKKYQVDGELSLRKYLETRGESLDDLREMFLVETMARELMSMKLRPKVPKPGMREMEAYYQKHKQEYVRPAGIRWREIFLPAESPDELAAARQKASEIRARIAKGEKFEAIAKAESGGATARNGGDWGWSEPGGYAVKPVNVVLANLPEGKVSDAIEGPRGIYLVRVDGRREKGPAPFVDVQQEVANKVFGENFRREQDALLKHLRERTFISTMNSATGQLELMQPPGKTDENTRRVAYP